MQLGLKKIKISKWENVRILQRQQIIEKIVFGSGELKSSSLKMLLYICMLAVVKFNYSFYMHLI